MPAAVQRYLDQVVDIYDPASGLTLPDKIAWMVSLDAHPNPRNLEVPEAAWRKLLTALVRDPGAPRVRTLILHDCSPHTIDGLDIPFEEADPNLPLRRHPGRLAALERLHIGLFPARLPPNDGYCQGVAPAMATLPALARLHLVGERGWNLIPEAGHPALRELILHVDETDDEPLAALAQGPFPRLEAIDLWVGLHHGDVLARSLSDALAAARVPQLRRLVLRAIPEPDVVAELAALAALREQLHALTLTDAPDLDDDALRPLFAAPWPILKTLDLRGTAASPGLAGDLRTRGVEVTTD